MPAVDDLYGRKSLFKPVLSVLREKPACSEALQLFDQFAGGTLGQAVDALLDLGNRPWVLWFFLQLRKILTPKIRERLLASLGDCPATKFSLFLDVEDLTDKEDRLLMKGFEGRLPTAEAELESGIVQRKKLGGGS